MTDYGENYGQNAPCSKVQGSKVQCSKVQRLIPHGINPMESIAKEKSVKRLTLNREP